MGNAAFIRGFADTTLKSWEARDEMKRQMQKAEMVEKLRRETSDYDFNREEGARKTRVSKDFSSFDESTGVWVNRNENNVEINRTKGDAGQIADVNY